jgi:uncharacterized transporter YbjL
MLGGGLMFAPITLAAVGSPPPGHDGVASGLLNATRQIGGALGLAVLGTVATGTGHGLRSAAAARGGTLNGTALTIAAAIFVLTGLTGALVLPARLRGPRGP